MKRGIFKIGGRRSSLRSASEAATGSWCSLSRAGVSQPRWRRRSPHIVGLERQRHDLALGTVKSPSARRPPGTCRSADHQPMAPQALTFPWPRSGAGTHGPRTLHCPGLGLALAPRGLFAIVGLGRVPPTSAKPSYSPCAPGRSAPSASRTPRGRDTAPACAFADALGLLNVPQGARTGTFLLDGRAAQTFGTGPPV